MSGKGKDVLRVNLEPYMEPESFTVTVLSPDKTVGAQRSITIRPSEPILELYFDHPLYGTLFHSALGAETNIYDEEMSFVAVPYFTSRISASTGYTYAWSVNGTTIAPNTSRPSLLTINAAQSTGKALVKLEVRHPSNPFLSSLNSWPLTFTRAGGTPTQGSSANPFIQ